MNQHESKTAGMTLEDIRFPDDIACAAAQFQPTVPRRGWLSHIRRRLAHRARAFHAGFQGHDSAREQLLPTPYLLARAHFRAPQVPRLRSAPVTYRASLSASKVFPAWSVLVTVSLSRPRTCYPHRHHLLGEQVLEGQMTMAKRVNSYGALRVRQQ
jgi:hypothetical protein